MASSKGNTHDLIITFFIQDLNQIRIHKPIKHLRWSSGAHLEFSEGRGPNFRKGAY